MSALRPSPTTPGAILCPRCGSALGEDQAWCLECGLAARTRVHPPPSWRLPVAATLLALVLLAAGIAFALAALLDDPQPAQAPATVTAPATTPPAVTTQAPTVTTPGTPGATTPGATTPGVTTPGTATTPGTTTPGTTTPGSGAPQTRRTFTVPGVGIELPANG